MSCAKLLKSGLVPLVSLFILRDTIAPPQFHPELSESVMSNDGIVGVTDKMRPASPRIVCMRNASLCQLERPEEDFYLSVSFQHCICKTRLFAWKCYVASHIVLPRCDIRAAQTFKMPLIHEST